jgi:hypothetical protein
MTLAAYPPLPVSLVPKAHPLPVAVVCATCDTGSGYWISPPRGRQRVGSTGAYRLSLTRRPTFSKVSGLNFL